MAKQAAAVLIACALVAALATPLACAQERAPRLGIVDMAKVLSTYKEFQESDRQYKDFLRERQGQYAERATLRLLRPGELKEYQNLKAVTAPTEEQKSRMEQLRAVAETRETELRSLLSEANPTDEQKTRRAELQDLARKSDPELEELRKRMNDEVDQRNKELSDTLNRKIEAALAVVARDKRLDFVLAKDAVLWGGVDITDDLLAKLNAGA